MKFPGEAAERVARSLIEAGPATIPVIAERLAITPAGARKHIQALLAGGFVQAQDRPPYGPVPERRRGRPASVYAITTEGRVAAEASTPGFALDAVRFLARDEAAIADFAADRAQQLATRLAAAVATRADSDDDPVQHVADALTIDGYAATVEPVSPHAVQLCQHHCPIVEIAAEFPQFCEAETQALGQVLGRHVTRLATLAHGDGVCTTLIPTNHAPRKVHTSRKRVSA